MATARKSTAKTSADETTDGKTAAEKAPKKTTTRRKTAKAADDEAEAEPEKKTTRKRATTSRAKKAATKKDEDGDDAEEAPKKTTRKRATTSRAKKADAEDAGSNDDSGDDEKPAAKKVVRRRTTKKVDEDEGDDAGAEEKNGSAKKKPTPSKAVAKKNSKDDEDDDAPAERPARMTSYSSHGDDEEDDDPPPYRRGISRERDRDGGGAQARDDRDDRGDDRGGQQPRNQQGQQQGGGNNNDGGNRDGGRPQTEKQRRWEERRQRRMERRRERQMARQNDGGGNNGGGGQGGGGGFRDRYNDRPNDRGGNRYNDRGQGGPGGGPDRGNDRGNDRYDDRDRGGDRWDEYTPTGADEGQKVKLSMNELSQRSITELMAIATDMGFEAPGSFERSELIMRILQMRAERSGNAYAVGVVDQREKDQGGYLRFADNDYLPSPNDVQITSGQMRKFSLRKGDEVAGIIRRPGKKERWWQLLKVDTINDESLDVHRQRTLFENLTPLYPQEKFELEWNPAEFTTRVIDLMAPLGKGQRSMIVAPPRTGKTMIMQAIAKAIEMKHPDAALMVLLIDERPEEVTDMARTVKGEVISSTFDEPAERHVAIAEMTIERAKRMVEKGKDVIILMDSITRLARAYNLTVRQSGKLMSGGLDANALQRPKRFFGAARNIEEGGSLTIIGTALIDTGSAMDQVIFEEFKGTGNNEINLYRPLAERRIFPAIDIHKSGTRKEELLLDDKSLQRVWLLRKALNELQPIETMEFLIERLKKAETNKAFLESMNG